MQNHLEVTIYNTNRLFPREAGGFSFDKIGYHDSMFSLYNEEV